MFQLPREFARTVLVSALLTASVQAEPVSTPAPARGSSSPAVNSSSLSAADKSSVATAGVSDTATDGFASPVQLSPVFATRQSTDALTVPATLNVIDERSIQDHVVTDIRSLMRYEPGVSVVREPRGRGSEASIEVRGIGGQRLGMLVDGVRLPSGFMAAGVSVGQLRVDTATLSRAEILRGPASSLYGSDALAGVVLFRTLSPEDFLEGNESFGGNASVGYEGASNGRYANANLAFRAGITQNLISVTGRTGHGLENNDSEIRPNPQRSHQQNVLLKSRLQIDPAQSLTFTAEDFRHTVRTNQDSLLGPALQGFRVTDSHTHDNDQRSRLGLAWKWEPENVWFDSMTAQVDYQLSKNRERTYDIREYRSPAPQLLRYSLLSGRESQWSGSFMINGHQSFGPTNHNWNIGLDLLWRSTSLYQDGHQQTVAGTNFTTMMDGQRYPRKTAPDSTMRNIGLFVQDEISFADTGLKLTPSLRYDYYKLTPKPDSLYATANVKGIEPVTLSGSAITPRLGISQQWAPGQVVYANYVTGFRMPTSTQLNRIGQTPASTFIHDFVPAPDLKPEKSHGVELGFRGASDNMSYEITGFYNRYHDFIDTEMIAYIPPGQSGGPRAIRRFQSRNIGNVKIYGVEARGSLTLDSWLKSAHHWTLSAAGQWSRGVDITHQQPLNSIQPLRLVTTIQWDHSSRRYGMQLTTNVVAGKKRVNRDLPRTGPIAAQPLTTAGYATVDAGAYVRLNSQTTLNLAVFNLFDRKYYDWSTVSRLQGNDPELPAYTAPGRHVAASLKVEF